LTFIIAGFVTIVNDTFSPSAFPEYPIAIVILVEEGSHTANADGVTFHQSFDEAKRTCDGGETRINGAIK